MSKIRWTRSRDGVPRVTVRAEYRLSADDIASLLAHVEEVYDDDPDEMTAADVRRVVRDTLYSGGVTVTMDADLDDRHRKAAERGFGFAPMRRTLPDTDTQAGR